MSYLAKRKIVQLLDQLKDINEGLTKEYTKFSKADFLGKLIKCQNLSMEIGNRIEMICAGETLAVRQLEEYCESVYRIYQEVMDHRCEKAEMIVLLKRLDDINKNIMREVPEEYEVVFLPYKASMWDSLESIWQASVRDTKCRTFVIPIPYYDKNPDGSIGCEHYEYEQFPEDVPLINYGEVNLEIRQPDVIYIHNPYDNCNRVTSVHPQYYAKNLRNCTEKLVYVPYFVLEGSAIPSTLAIVPGVLYSDYVIVRNNVERQEYINRFVEQQIPIDIAKKLLPLGSPKLDKIKCMSKVKMTVPEEWREKIKGKKIIFYNTTLNGVLKEDEYLDKIQTVFEYFRKRKDVVLIWRPHPLLETTIKSMREKLFLRYLSIKHEYLIDNIGILDRSEDMSIAIALSDAYYGDGSSIVWLYLETGKKVLLQNTNVRKQIVQTKLFISDMVCKEDVVYFVPYDGTGIWQYSVEKRRFRILSGNLLNTPVKYRFLMEQKDKLILPPYSASEILVCDKKQGRVDAIPLTAEHNVEGILGYYKGAASYQEHLYFIGEPQSQLLKYNTKTGTRKSLDKWRKSFFEKYGYYSFIYYHTGEVCVVNHSFFVALASPNLIMEYDMQEDKPYFYQVGDIPMQYGTICYDGKNFWLSGSEPVLVCWDKENDIITKFYKFPDDFKLSKSGTWNELFCCSILVHNFVYFAPFKGSMIIRVNLESKKIEKVKDIGEDNICFLMKRWKDNQIFFQISDENLNNKVEDFLLDIHNNVIARDVFSVTNSNLDGIENLFNNNNVIQEMNDEYLNYLLKVELQSIEGQMKMGLKEPAGAIIYDRIKQECNTLRESGTQEERI